MDLESRELDAYLAQLNILTNGDPAAQVSMYAVGESLGIDRDEAARLAETLFMGGHAELKTLSGGIGITAMGLQALGISPAGTGGPVSLSLSNERVMTDLDREHTNTMVRKIRSAMTNGADAFEALESVVIDLKTIEVHLLSPAPKNAVVRELFASVRESLPAGIPGELADSLAAMTR